MYYGKTFGNSDVNKDLVPKAKAKDLAPKDKAKDSVAKDSVPEVTDPHQA